ncbi:hypothetical protein [Microlunatus sp. GCM10028923]|uniref:hypothetical protein n=1 Tax=Microlunatus sp. GCM10028923 TaxID=3273400 RepID=UPI00360F7BF0
MAIEVVGRRSFLGGSLAAGAGVIGSGLAAPTRALAAPGQEYLGTPITGVTTAGMGFTQDGRGRPLAVMIAGGTPSIFSVVDAVSGELIKSEPVSSVKQAWTYKTAPDGRVYIGTQSSGQALRFDPDDRTLTVIKDRPFGQTHFWATTITADGRVHFGTYPDGRVITYDPATDAWIDQGQVLPGAQYVRSLGTDGTMLYAGTGAVARVVRVDPATGQTAEIALPDDVAGESFVYDLDVAEHLLFARMSPSSVLLVYDLIRDRWVDRIADVVGLHVSSAADLMTADGRRRVAFYSPTGGPVTGYDLDSGERHPTALTTTYANRDWAWLQLPGLPRQTLMTGNSLGDLAAFNPITHEVRTLASRAEGTPYIIRSLGTGPAGDVFAGGYLTPRGVARVDPETGATTQLAWGAQVEGMTAHGTDLVLGVYPHGKLYRYDTTQPWSSGVNPGAPVDLGSAQDRPVALTPAGELTAVGSVPEYGQLGGALSLYDRASGAVDVYRDVVPAQSVVTLIHRDGVIYGGTAIWGGLGIAPTATDAVLFGFDLATRKVIFSTVPVPGETSIGGLAFDDTGALWGTATNTLFRYDLGTGSVTQRKTYFQADPTVEYYTGHGLFWHQGRLVGSTAGTIFTVDPATLDLTTIATNMTNLAIDRLGNLYYSKRGTGELYRWTSA